MLKIEKTLQSVRDLLDRLSKEGLGFAFDDWTQVPALVKRLAGGVEDA